MLPATAHLLRLLTGQLRHRFVLQLVVGDALGAVELTQVASCPADPHPLLHAAESVVAHGCGSSAAMSWDAFSPICARGSTVFCSSDPFCCCFCCFRHGQHTLCPSGRHSCEQPLQITCPPGCPRCTQSSTRAPGERAGHSACTAWEE